MPTAEDGTLELGDGKMPDMDNEQAEIILGESAATHSALMAESKANAQSAHSVVRHSGARKFNQEDPIEAAAVEMILQRNS